MLSITQLLLRTLDVSHIMEGVLKLAAVLPVDDEDRRHQFAARALMGQSLTADEIAQIAQALSLPISALQSAYEVSASQRMTWRETFSHRGPHIYVETAGPVTQITFAALLHNKLKIHPVPESWRHESALKLLQRMMPLVRELAAKTTSPLAIFGEVTGFTLYLSADCAHQFDRVGNWLGGTTPLEYDEGKVMFSFENEQPVEARII